MKDLTGAQVTQLLIGLATLLGALGMWLMLPRGNARGRMFGALLGAIGLGVLASQLPSLGDWASQSVLFILGAVTIVAAVATVTFRSPVYCAIWFGLSLLGTAGLFLFQGAQFLGVATIVVYAGAILVTFLFVLMLAQPEGHAPYDRVSWEAMLSSATGALLVGIMTLTVFSVFENSRPDGRPQPRFEAIQLNHEILHQDHVAHLGRDLFSRHLIAVEIAGTLLLAALVGSIAIVSHVRPQRQFAGRRTR